MKKHLRVRFNVIAADMPGKKSSTKQKKPVFLVSITVLNESVVLALQNTKVTDDV